MKKKLIIVIGSLDVGGAEQHLLRVLPKIQEHGWNIEVVVLTKRGALAPILEKTGIPVTLLVEQKKHIDSGIFQKMRNRFYYINRIFACVYRLSRKLQDENIAIIHFFLPGAYVLGMFATLLARFRGYKLMSRRSLNLYQKKRRGLAFIEKQLHGYTNMILGNSNAILEELKTKENVPANKLKLIYNGIDIYPYETARSKSEVRKELNIEESDLVIIIVANLIPYKGHADLLNAFGKIKNKIQTKWHLLVIGRDDGIGERLKNQAKELGICENLQLLGTRSDVPSLLKCSDIGILCSHEEGFSNAILEGMAANLPMIVTDVGGNKEAVIHNKTGYVIPPRNVDALADAILTLANNPEIAKEFGHQGYLRVKDKFSLDKCVQEYIGLYDSLYNQDKNKLKGKIACAV